MRRRSIVSVAFVCFVPSFFINSTFYVAEVNLCFLLDWRGKSRGKEASPASGSHKRGSRSFLVEVYGMLG